MSEQYHVRVAKEHFVFSAAHFITFGDNICERLHGHNYAVAAEVHGPLDANQYVVDFILVRDTLAKLTQELDHHVLLPTKHPTIRVEVAGQEVTATFEERRWVFPLGDCVLLEVENTTAELLARVLGERLHERLREGGYASPAAITVSVDECNGQEGVWSWTAD
ncbi:6-pyruvoyl tetrahydropterin synthase [Posidoniimonas polymericola]|uniref:6-carboxy-5,6,7,8-tetrahydropterin synthase n=1 Tax=Posidoniimonas polymericola TaxID=2528002 RepID=A0A5C5YIH3_9BACT|nr:6-carboxytetrahydropterin synthase [Posidoniimonas polymericola]TWT74675.1 6-pyruvoyl tetrahydropterin synthase [Posidoniimonas polymericola]